MPLHLPTPTAATVTVTAVAARSLVVLGEDDSLFAACEFAKCKMGTDGLRQCSVRGCTRALHHCCFNEWADAHGVPDLPGNKALCRECAEDVCLTATGTAVSQESIKKSLEGDSQPNWGKEDKLLGLTAVDQLSDVSSPPSLPESSEEMEDSTRKCQVVALLSLDPDKVSDRVKLCLTLRSTAPARLPWHADANVDHDAATEVGDSSRWVVCPEPRAEGVRPHDTGVGAQPPTPGRCVRVPVPEVGTRCCIRGLNGLVWDKRTCSETDEQFLAVIFDSWLTRGWESYALEEFENLATAPLTVAADDIAAVFVCKQEGKGSLPAAALSGALKKQNKFYAFSHYKPLPPSDLHSDPPHPFALEPGTVILCQQPCVAAGSGRNQVLPSNEIIVVEYCGILVAENSFKLDRKPYHRWVICLQDDDALIFPFSSIVSLADASQRASLSAKSGRAAACARTLAAAHSEGRQPGGLENVYKAAQHKLSANAEPRPLSANAEEAPGRPSTGMGLRERRLRPRLLEAHDAENELGAGPPLRRRRTNKADPSTSTPDSSSTASEIPMGLRGWGVAKLDTCTLAQLCLALTENGLEQPPKHIVDKAGWAKNALMTRLELLPFTQSQKNTQARL